MPTSTFARVGEEIAAFLLAACCAGCDAPGELLCDACRVRLAPSPRESTTPGGLPVVAALGYDDIAARCIRRLKGEGETLLARPLGLALRATLARVTADGAVLVPIPTGRAAFRRRGYRVPDLLVRRAGGRPVRLLAPARPTADQRGLSTEERAENVRGSMRMRAGILSTVGPVVLVDDVVTTGATFDEAARVLSTAGVEVRAAVALAATPLHRRIIENAPATRRK